MASITDPISHSMQEQISELLKPHRVCLMKRVGLYHSTQHRGKPPSRVLVLGLWRGFMITSTEPARVESSFSYLEICSINIHSLSQVVLETDRETFSFSVSRVQDLEAMVSHMTTSLKKIFPDSSPGRLLKKIPPDLQERLWKMTSQVEEQLEGQPISCGGFSDTYAALCDFNELPCREEIQWDVDNIYHVHQCREFNLLDFSHLDNKDLALAVAAVSFNQWFTKISCRDIKLSAEVQQQLVFLLSRSPSLEELWLEASGIKPDFAIKMAASLREHSSSSLHSLNLSANHIEDKGVIALSQELGNLPAGLKHLSLSRVSMSSKGLGSLCQVFSSSQLISSTLMHLDLSGNPGSLATEEATFLFRFLSNTNCLSHLDLSGTDCPLDTLFVSLSVGCCSKLSHLNLAKNPFSHRKIRAVTRSIQEFFSQCSELKHVCLSATKLPPQALRLLLQGLATNTHLRGLELDLSSCELRSAGAQVIQEHIFETNAISSLDISDNGFESDMVTLVLSIGRCHSLRHLALGRNFAMKSRALTDVLQRIAQIIQEEECPLESLSVCDSKLKTGTTTLINLLGSNATLAKVDISGNAIGDTGAKMLAKALLTNTKLRTLVWDRNQVTARGYQDVADALERNFTLQQMSLPLSDATQSYRNNPDRTEEALQKIQRCLHRNNQRLTGEEFQQGLGAQHAEKLVQGLCRLENSLQPLTPSNLQEVQADLLSAEDVLHNTRKFLRLLPSLYELGRKPSGGDVVHCILTDTSTTLSNEITGDIQELAQALLTGIEGVCPRVVQRANVCERLAECVSKKIRQLNTFLTETLVEQTGHILNNKLCEIRQSLSVSLSESIIEQILQDLAVEQGKLDEHIRDNLSAVPKNSIPHLRLVDHDFPTDEYVPVIWRHTFHSKSMRPAPSIKSLLDVDWEQQSSERGERESTAAHLQQHHHHHQTHREQPHARGGGGGGGGGGGEVSGGEEGEGRGGRERGRCASADGRGLACTVTLLSAAASGGQLRSESPSPSPSPPPPPPRSSSSSSASSPRPSPSSQRRRRGRGDEAAEDAAEAVAAAVAGARGASLISPRPPPPPDRPLPREEEAAGRRGSSPAREAPSVPLGGPGPPAGPMELLPTQGQTLRHYTASRPRPRRTRTQPPSTRPQEPVLETDNEAMGRVDEGVEEFFTKKILPDYTLKGQWEESIPAQGTPPESSSDPSVLLPVSSSSSDNFTTSSIITSPTAPPSNASSTPTLVTSPSSSVSPPTSSSSPPPTTTTTTTTTAPPSKNIKKKFGDFFAFKRARTGRAAKAGGGEAGGGEGVKVKRTSIADLIRPLREAKEREREREREKEREKERGSRLVEDVNLSNDAAVTEGTVATDGCLQGDKRDKMAPATTVTTTTPPSEATPPSPTTATPGLTTATSNPEEKGVASLPAHPGHTPASAAGPPTTVPPKEQEKSWTLEKERKKGGGTPDGERRLKVSRRSLREGKSQSLILLTGLEPEEKDSSHSKKYASESTSSFEQRLQVMLHRMGVAKTSPADTKTSQNKDEELRKANSEGAILDKPEPPPTFLKPRTMSSSSDTRRPMRAVEPLRSDPPLHPKPVVPERPVGPLPPKPVIAAKPCLPTPAAPGGGGGDQTTAAPPQHAFHASQHLSSSAPRTTSPGLVQPWPPALDRRPEDSKTQALNGSHEEHVAQVAVQKDSPGPTSAPSPRRDTPPAPSPRRGPSAQGRSERAQSVTDESLPKPRPRMKPLPQRRAVSVHEDALTMTQELKAVLERSPLRHRGNRGDLSTCTEDTPTGEDPVEMGDGADEAQGKSSKKEEEEDRENREKNKMEKRRTGHGVTTVYEAASAAVETPSLEAVEPDPASATPAPALSLRPASALGSEKVQSPEEKSPAPSTTMTLSHTVGKSHMTPSQEKTPSTTPATADVGESTQEERGETVSKQHTEKAEPPDQRTETLLFK